MVKRQAADVSLLQQPYNNPQHDMSKLYQCESYYGERQFLADMVERTKLQRVTLTLKSQKCMSIVLEPALWTHDARHYRHDGLKTVEFERFMIHSYIQYMQSGIDGRMMDSFGRLASGNSGRSRKHSMTRTGFNEHRTKETGPLFCPRRID